MDIKYQERTNHSNVHARAENFSTFFIMHVQGFPKKTPILKINNITDLESDDKEGKIMENIKF